MEALRTIQPAPATSSAATHMRLALHSETLGPIELQATLRGATVQASLHVAQPAARDALRHELPQLQQVLADRNLPVTSISLAHGTSVNTGSAGAGAHAYSGNDRRQTGNGTPPRTWVGLAQTGNSSSARASEAAAALPGLGRISVRV
ncbi:MAG TPA: flagellar hook-length control protein FliK [Terriglobales bacterium]|nr:flagellar hook-length control protein FliK [Terriglobales bacterium]